MERERIGVAVLAFKRAGETEKMRRLPDLIERDVREREINLKRRRMPAPFAEALAEDQRIVAKAQRICGERIHQMWVIPSGIL